MQPKKRRTKNFLFLFLFLLNSKVSLFSKSKQKQKNDYYCIQFMKWTVKCDDDPFLTMFCAHFSIRINKIFINCPLFKENAMNNLFSIISFNLINEWTMQIMPYSTCSIEPKKAVFLFSFLFFILFWNGIFNFHN